MKRGNALTLATPLGQQVQIQHRTVTFTEILYDGSHINIGWLTEADTDPISFVQDVMFTVDGAMSPNYTLNASGEEQDNGTFAGTISILVEEKLPDAFALGIRSRDEAATLASFPVERKGEMRTYGIAQTRTYNADKVTYD
ncbi:hypothetical protein GNF78_16575, partial [Clostridium perfringens]